jgi:hypothetical protein
MISDVKVAKTLIVVKVVLGVSGKIKSGVFWQICSLATPLLILRRVGLDS